MNPMEAGRFPLPVELDPSLVEEAVLLALRGQPGNRYWRAREEAYALREEEEREAAFRRLARGEFEALDLGAPLRQALAEEPLVTQKVARCRAVRTPSGREEGAELFVRSDAGPEARSERTLAVFLRPASFSRPGELLMLLRHELVHVRDMVDPRFGDDPSLPSVDGGPMRVKLALQRYRVLWDTVIDGRLFGSGRAGPRAREVRRAEFAAAFGTLGKSDQEFERWFGMSAPTHQGLLEYALEPPPAPTGTAPAVALCPLCRCPTWAEARFEGALSPGLLAEIGNDFPSWRPEEGLCRQCADLYRSRSLSRGALNLLAGSSSSGRLIAEPVRQDR